MLAYTCVEKGHFELIEKPMPELQSKRDAIVRVTVNVETFCGECFFSKKGFVNTCTDPHGGWALGCCIDGVIKVAIETR